MLKHRLANIAIVASLSLAACSGGGGGTGPSTPGGGSTSTGPQSQLSTPKFTLRISSGSSAGSNAKTRKPQYVGAATTSATITLVSSTSTPGLNGTSLTTTLNSSICTTSAGADTCTITGPPVPAGTDVFKIVTYDAANKPLAQSSTTATPAASDPSFTVTAGTDPTFTITLFGIPASFTFPTYTNGTPGTPVASTPLGLAVLDDAGETIAGQFANPVTVTDADAFGGTQGTQLLLTGASAGASQTLNSSTDEANAAFGYGGIAGEPATFTATSPTATTATGTFGLATSLVVLKPSEVDLSSTVPGTSGNTGAFVASQVGWSNAPYNRTFTAGQTYNGTPEPATCASGTAATVFSVTTTDHLTFTDTVPTTSPASGSCTLPIYGSPGDAGTAVTLTFTSGGFVIQGHRR